MKIKTDDRVGDAQLTCVPRCPYCSVAAPQILLVHNADPARPFDGSPKSRWAAYRCTSCASWIVVKGDPAEAVANPRIVEIVPGFAQAHEDLPDQARRFLDQAMQTLASPDASAVMSGSAVDAMLKQLGYEKGSVYERIDAAVKDRHLTEPMGEWAHSVRLGANRPRHADKEAPHLSSDEARQSLEFAEALGSFLFVLTAKINRGIEAAKATGS
ncbi:MAG: DUF4145 domain-containing protein [Pseudomonadota bacterium]|nr:DUF4145 domain-containing protein [Pseudomonadota bacterium]